MTKQINVVGAVIVRNGTILCAQRGDKGHLAGLWEFPGGKIESNETPQDALVREVEEELHCAVVVRGHVETTTHNYPFATITLATFYCELVNEQQPQRTEHAQLAWSLPQALGELTWAPADLPAVARIQRDFAE